MPRKPTKEDLRAWLEAHHFPALSFKWDPELQLITWTYCGEEVRARIWHSTVPGMEFNLWHIDDPSKPFTADDLRQQCI